MSKFTDSQRRRLIRDSVKAQVVNYALTFTEAVDFRSFSQREQRNIFENARNAAAMQEWEQSIPSHCV